jgi:hypothetical protein
MALSKGQILSLGKTIGVGVAEAATAGTIIKDLIQGTLDTPPNIFNSKSLLVFPYNLPSIADQNFCIIFQFYKYNRPSILYPPTLENYGAIALPLPSDLNDSLKLSYDESSRSSPIIGAALENSKNITGAMSNIENNVTAVAEGALSAVGVAGLQAINNQVGSSTVAKILQMAGLAQNPFLSVLFNCPVFKRYTFKWTFIPERESDSIMLRNILDKFRYHSLPDIANTLGGSLLTYPDMVVPKIIPDKYMFDMKQCVIEDVSINYAPGETVAFFPSMAPNAIQLTLNLLEIEFWVKTDLLSPKYHSSDFISSTGLPSQGGPSII